MEIPSQEQHAFSNLALIETLLHFTRDSICHSQFDDLELISDLDKVRIGLKCAIHKMETLIKKTQERKRGCY